jgi:hypothetical protein
MRRLLALAALPVVAAACSQTAALAPVGGDRLAEVRFATIDVLMSHDVDVLVAPVCTASGTDDETIDCRGTTTDERPITASSSADEQDRLVVTVGDEAPWVVSVQDVLTAAARPAP